MYLLSFKKFYLVNQIYFHVILLHLLYMVRVLLKNVGQLQVLNNDYHNNDHFNLNSFFYIPFLLSYLLNLLV